MRRSKRVVAGAVIVAGLACWLVFRRQTFHQQPEVSEEAQFIGSTRQAYDKRPRFKPSQQEPQAPNKSSDRPVSTFPVQQRKPSDDPTPARLNLVVLDGATRLPVREVKVTAVNRATGETVAEQQLPEGRGTIALPTAALRLTIEHPDYRERGLWLEFSSAGVQSSQHVVELTRQIRLTGTVRDQNGRAVSGATIRLPGSRGERSPVTGLDGRFECKVSLGNLQGAIIKGADTAVFQADITAATQTLNLTLPIRSASITFSGRVLNEKSEPADGAKVFVKLLAGPQEPAPIHALTVEEDGTFAISIPESGASVTIRLDGYETIDETISLTSDLHREYSLKPLLGFSVTLVAPEGSVLTKGFRINGVGSSISKVFPFADGRYYATDYPVEIQATATELGYGNSEIALLASYEPEVALKIEPGGTVRGRAVDQNGVPVRRFSYLLLQGQKLYLSQSLLDSADGAFCIRHVAPGRYTLKIVAAGGMEIQRDIVVELSRDCLVEIVVRPSS